MKKYIFSVICLLSVCTCDDGEIIEVNFDFQGQLKLCNNNNESYIIYDDKESPSESLTLIIPKTNDDVPYIDPTPNNNPTQIEINATSNRFIYRTYNRNLNTNELCNIVPASDLNITSSYEASSGTVEISVTIEDDDGDGVPSDKEGRGEPDENGEYPNAQDTDGDGIPDYQDADDDNDNVPTSLEIDSDDTDGDGDPTTNPLNTDGEDNPDYLDTDDDNDGTPTIQEDLDGDQNLFDDSTINSEGFDVPNFRYFPVNLSNTSVELISTNQFTRSVAVSILIKNVALNIVMNQELNFGTLEYQVTITQELIVN